MAFAGPRVASIIKVALGSLRRGMSKVRWASPVAADSEVKFAGSAAPDTDAVIFAPETAWACASVRRNCRVTRLPASQVFGLSNSIRRDSAGVAFFADACEVTVLVGAGGTGGVGAGRWSVPVRISSST